MFVFHRVKIKALFYLQFHTKTPLAKYAGKNESHYEKENIHHQQFRKQLILAARRARLSGLVPLDQAYRGRKEFELLTHSIFDIS